MSHYGIGLFLLICGLFVLLGLGFFVLWILVIVDIATKETDAENQKVIWLIIVVFTGFIGELIYLLVRRPQRVKQLGR
jgi:hypothetical protein